MNAQISFLEGTFTLIHVPLKTYPHLLQPIIRTLLPQTQSLKGSITPPDRERDGLTTDDQHSFLNVSVTPLECSIVCHSSWAANVFDPVIKALPKDVAKTISVSTDEYLVISVISAALVAHGFQLAQNDPNYKFKGHENPTVAPPQVTSSVSELQTRTFDLLRKNSVVPYMQEDLHLVQCSGREISHLNQEFSHHSSRRLGNGNSRPSWLDHVDTKLYTAMVSAFVSQPKFLSVTLAKEEPPSLLLDKSLLDIFGDSLVGDTEGELMPIFLDLSGLSYEATGIVCGVAGKLVADMETQGSSELSYLSTARAGAVILSTEQAARALTILKPMLEN
ncbi:unnamed protein product [Parascedosporium putredinis]|uniref:CASTOR ACT domain-containing protein n=1 Tax=Parascedosporium putredinis TaxID=1442378 RepID=A0A9P1M5M9_9PEZI|nr:unnamed protein product [Parascedosporium putredinis]CAI7987445.1 unnamed protein product [Parascedosporium putredinis]